jgi:hypothetical protein
MAKVVKLKKSDLVRIVEQTLNILPNRSDLPRQVAEMEKIVNEGKRTINRMYHLILDISLRDMLEDPEKYNKLSEDLRNTQVGYRDKHNQYYDVINAYWDDYLNDELDSETHELYTKGERLVNELDNLYLDMDNLVDIYDDIHGQTYNKDILKDFTKTYPDQTININKSIGNDEN